MTALVMSGLNYLAIKDRLPNQEDIRKMVTEEVEAQDRARIVAITPKAKLLYKDMLPGHFDEKSFAPTTFVELIDPLMNAFLK